MQLFLGNNILISILNQFMKKRSCYIIIVILLSKKGFLSIANWISSWRKGNHVSANMSRLVLRWYDSANMSKLVLKWCNLIQFCKHVKTCPKMIWFDTILQTCQDLSLNDAIWYDSANMSIIVLNWYEMVRLDCMTKYSKIEQIGNRNLTLTTTKLF